MSPESIGEIAGRLTVYAIVIGVIIYVIIRVRRHKK